MLFAPSAVLLCDAIGIVHSDVRFIFLKTDSLKSLDVSFVSGAALMFSVLWILLLGSLFRSTAFTKNETELAIIVTPHLVRPSRPGQPLRTPLDATSPVNDPDRFLIGKKELTPAEKRWMDNEPARTAQGHILDMRNGEEMAQWMIVPVVGSTPGRRYGHTIIFSKPHLLVFGGNTG